MSAELTALYRGRLRAIEAAALQQISAAFTAGYDDSAPLLTLARIGALAGWHVTAAQQLTAAEAAAYLRALAAEAAALQLAAVAPFPVPPGLVGTSAAGGTIGELTGLAPAVFWSRLSGGAPRDDAAAAAAAWLNRIAASEPYRAANATVTSNAAADPRLYARYRRVIAPGACGFCSAIAAEGHASANAGFAAHGHCHCTASPDVNVTATRQQARAAR